MLAGMLMDTYFETFHSVSNKVAPGDCANFPPSCQNYHYYDIYGESVHPALRKIPDIWHPTVYLSLSVLSKSLKLFVKVKFLFCLSIKSQIINNYSKMSNVELSGQSTLSKFDNRYDLQRKQDTYDLHQNIYQMQCSIMKSIFGVQKCITTVQSTLIYKTCFHDHNPFSRHKSSFSTLQFSKRQCSVNMVPRSKTRIGEDSEFFNLFSLQNMQSFDYNTSAKIDDERQRNLYRFTS